MAKEELRIPHILFFESYYFAKKIVLKTVFTIGNEITGCDTLLFEIGAEYCCYAFLKGPEKTFQKISYVTYNEIDADKELAEILEEVKNAACEKVVVCSAFPQAFLTPKQGYQNDFILLNVIYDSPFLKYLKDDISEWQMNITYAMPSPIFHLIKEKFRFAEFIHVQTPVLKIFNGVEAADQITIHFSTQNFRVLVKKNKQIQLAQTYAYKTPLDVTYYLLKICYEFQMEQSQVHLVISGLIDQDSALYNELHNYFLNLHFAQPPLYALPENDYPHHYFSSLYNLAACVS